MNYMFYDIIVLIIVDVRASLDVPQLIPWDLEANG